jgi:hypothetical protein
MRFISLIISLQLGDFDAAAVDVMRPDDGPSLGPTTLDQPKPLLPAFRSGPLFELIQGWKSGAIPIPRFNHKTQKEVDDFLKFYGDSTDGQFGTDKVHAPNLDSEGLEWIPSGLITDQSDRDERISINTRRYIYKQGHTGVYEIESHPDKVIKYHAYCFAPNTDPYDATVVESYFMNRIALQDPDIALKVDFYSGYVSEPGSLADNQRKIPDVTCPGGVQPHIRYMIMERVGSSIFQYMYTKPDNRIPFLEAMQLGKQMISLMQRLHNLNIVHGDAHWANFAFKNVNTFSDLILIDFGRAKMVDKDAVFPDGRASGLVHPYTSGWELFDCRVSFRIDVYRTAQANAMLIYGMPYFNFLNGLNSKSSSTDLEDRRQNFQQRRKFRIIKIDANFWELEHPGLDLQAVLPSTDDATRDRIRTHLRNISTLILQPAQPYDKPNYDAIIAEYEAIIGILS